MSDLTVGHANGGDADVHTFDLLTNDTILDVNGNVSVTSKGILVADDTQAFTIAGNWTNAGTFTHSSGTVTFDTTGISNITGATTFNNFICTVPNKTLQFQAHSGGVPVITVAGTFTVTGTSGNPVNIYSNNSGVQWKAHFNADQTNVSYVNVRDGGCNTGTADVLLDGANATNVSNNDTCWKFGVAYTGTVYTDEGVTTMGAGRTVRFKVNGTGNYTGTTNGSGAYSAVLANVSAGNVVTAYLDGATEKAVTVTRSAGSSVSGINLYQNFVIVRSEDGSAITNTNLDQYDSGQDGDVQFTVTTGTLTVSAGNTLLLNTASTFTPGGDVTTPIFKQTAGTFNGGSGAVTISNAFTQTGGTFNSTSGDLAIQGNTSSFTHTAGGTFNHNNGTVIMAGNSTGQTIDVATSETFYNFTVSAGQAASSVNIASGDTIVVLNTFTQTRGAIGSGTVEARGGVTIGSLSDIGYGTLSFLVAGDQTITNAGGGATMRLNINKPSGTVNISGGDLMIGSFVLSSGIFTSTSANLIIGSNASVFTHTSGGTFNHNNGTVTMAGNSTGQMIDVATSETFYNFTYDAGQAASALAISSGDTLIIAGNFTHGYGQINGGIIEARNNVTVNANAEGGSTQLNLTGSNAQTITVASGGNFLDGNITLNKTAQTDTVTLGSDVSWNATGQNVTVTSGTFRSGGFNITGGSGTFTVSDGASFEMSGNSDHPAGFGATSYGTTSTVRYLQNQAKTITNKNYGNLELKPSAAVTFTLPVALNALAGNLVLGDGTNAGIITAATNNPPNITIKGDFTINANVTYTKGTGTTSFKKGGVQAFTDSTSGQDLGICQVIANLSNNTTLNLGSNALMTSLTIDASQVFSHNGSNTLTLTGAGTPFVINGTFTPSSGTVDFVGAGAATVPAITYNHLGIKPGSNASTHTASSGSLVVGGVLTVGNGTNTGTFNLDTNDPSLDINGNLVIAANGTLVASGSGAFSIAGNWTNAGTFTHSGGGVTFDSASVSTLSGATTFNNFTCVTPSKTLKFEKHTVGVPVITFAGTFTINGTSGNEITISSDTPSTQWKAHFNAAQNISYASVLDSGCDAGTSDVLLANSISVSNNDTCWNFGTTYSGTVYVDEGTTPMGAGRTVRIKVNGSGSYSTSTNGSGVFSINGLAINVGNTVTAYLDGGSEKAVTLTHAANSGNVAAFNLYQNFIMVRNEGAGAASNSTLDQYDSAQDTDIPYTVNNGTLALTVDPGMTLYVPSGSAYSPSADVSTPAFKQVGGTFNGDFVTMAVGDFILAGGTFNATGGTMTVSGNYTHTAGGTFNPNNGTVAFSASTGGSGSVTWDVSTSETFRNLTVTGANYALNMGAGDTFIVTGTFTFTSISGNGTSINGGTLELRGSVVVGSLTGGGTAIASFPVAGDQTITASGGVLPNVNINKPSGTVSVTGDLALSSFTLAGGTFTSTSDTLTVFGNWTHTGGGTFAHNNGTVAVTGSTGGSLTFNWDVNTSETFYNFTVGIGNGITWNIAAADTLITLNTLTDSSTGNASMTGGTIDARGNVAIGATAVGGTINLMFTGTNAQTYTLATGGVPFSTDIVINKPSGAVTLGSNVTWGAANQDVTVTSGTLNTGGYNLTGSGTGTLTVSNGAFFEMSGNSNYPSSFGTYTYGGTSTVRYLQNTAKTITNASYGHLELKPSSTNTLTLPGLLNTIAGDLIMGDGTNTGAVNAFTEETSITVMGNVTLNTNAVFIKRASGLSAAITFAKGGTQTLTDNTAAPGQDLGQVRISANTTNTTLNLGSKANMTALTIDASQVFNANGANTLTLTGSGTPLDVTGTFTQSTGTVNYIGSSATTVTGLTYNNLGVGTTSDAAAAVTYTLGGNTIVQSVLTVGNAASTNTDVFDGSTRTLTLSGSGTPFVLTTKGALAWGPATTVQYTGTSDTTVVGTGYHNLSLLPASGNPTYTMTQIGCCTGIANNFIIGTGTTMTLDLATYDPYITIYNSGNLIVNNNVTYLAQDSGNGTFARPNGSFGFNVTFTDNNTTKQNLGNIAIDTGTANGELRLGSDIKCTKMTLVNTTGPSVLNLNGSNTLTLTGSGTGASRPLNINTGTFTPSTGTVQYTGTSATEIESTTYNHLSLIPAGTVTYTLGTAGAQTIRTDGTFTIGNGTNVVTATAATYNSNLDIRGDLTISANAVFTKSSVPITFRKGSAQTLTDNTVSKQDLGSIQVSINGTNTTLNLGSSVKFSNTQIHTAQTLSANGANTITCLGDWTNNGTFTPATGTVAFTGTGTQTLAGDTTFYNLSVTTAAPRTVNFTAGTTQSINTGGSITFEGADESNMLTLVSTTPGVQWNLHADNNTATESVHYVNVSDSNAGPFDSYLEIVATDGTSHDDGGNENWDFGHKASGFLTYF